jgi:hypothetical protein
MVPRNTTYHYTERVYIIIGWEQTIVNLMERSHTFFDNPHSEYWLRLQNEAQYGHIDKTVPITEYKQLGLSKDILNSIGLDHFVQWAHTTGQPVNVCFTRWVYHEQYKYKLLYRN